MSRVAVALSGGVDSAVVAALLLEQGHDVVGITGKMTESEFSELGVQNSQKVADKLGIELHVIDATKEFNKHVIKYFENSYRNGETPNPCIMCNKHIKWGLLFEYATKTLNCDYLATGHYANIKYNSGIYKLFPASDEHKDQLYFLFSLTQEHLSKTIFPLSEYKKTEVRTLAEKFNLPPKSAKESQDICFINAPMTTKKYLTSILENKKGNFVEYNTGKILGQHDGYWQYTVGQRKGIGLAAPEALYVIKTDSDTNTVYVGYKNELISKGLELHNFLWSYPKKDSEFEALVKIRYNMQPVKAHIYNQKDNIIIKFLEKVSGIASGQACVLYDIKDGHLLGGGFI